MNRPFKPCTNAASNLLAIDLRLNIACDGLKQKFQHAEHFTCDPLITQFLFDFQTVFIVILIILMRS